MPDQVKPPVLLSRLMGFVLATSLVVLGALGLTLWHMFPLTRPQVFFLRTEIRPYMEVRLYEMPIQSDPKNIERYLRTFILEYVRARNEITPRAASMQTKWGNTRDGVVNAWSTPDVYHDFTDTAMWKYVMRPDANITMSCTVEFPTGGGMPISLTPDLRRWQVAFTHLCTNNDGQTTRKDYTIIIEVDKKAEQNRWGDRLNNPLEIQIGRYDVQTGNGDPLDFE